MHYSEVVLGNKELGIDYSHISTLLLCNASTLSKQLVQNVRGGPMPVLLWSQSFCVQPQSTEGNLNTSINKCHISSFSNATLQPTHTPPHHCCKFSIQLLVEYKYHSCYTVCSQGACVKPNSSMISCQQANSPKIMAYWTERVGEDKNWFLQDSRIILNLLLIIMDYTDSKLLSKINSTNKNTWFLNIVQYLVI